MYFVQCTYSTHRKYITLQRCRKDSRIIDKINFFRHNKAINLLRAFATLHIPKLKLAKKMYNRVQHNIMYELCISYSIDSMNIFIFIYKDIDKQRCIVVFLFSDVTF